jgi:catechol 2,3-dioxygenase-like lactoylglutathione lyase family enzyme
MRLQLALNVDDIDQAVDFYSKLFDVEPAKRKPGYANFAIANPPLKLVLFEVKGAQERINHLGVEVFEGEEVTAATERLKAAGLETLVEDETTCCYAKQDKVWAIEPQGLRWEWYRVLGSSETFGAAPAEPSTPAAPTAQGRAADVEPRPGGGCCA